MKRITAVIMAAAMSLSLAACGKAGAEPKEDIPAMAGQGDSSRTEEASEPSAGPEETPEPDETPEQEPADPYGLGIALSDINWDAAVYDLSGDRMEDGWPSIYQNLAQTVSLMYGMWSEYGWHKNADGQDASFADVIAEAEPANRNTWENYDTMFRGEMYDILAPRAEEPFRMDSETEALLLRMDGLSMEQLAKIVELPLFRAFNGEDYMVIHNNGLVEFNNRQLATENNLPAEEDYPADVKLMADILGVSVEEYLALSAETDALFQEIKDSGEYIPIVSSTEEYAKFYNMTAEQYDAVLPIVRQIAEDALATGTTELDHIRAASRMLYKYVESGTYGFEPNYDSPYGLIIGGNYSCAGTAAAMCMTLTEMGYTKDTRETGWTNKGMWTHQWAMLLIDGQWGWADCMGGIADYGDYPFSCTNPNATYTDPETGETMWIDWTRQ